MLTLLIRQFRISLNFILLNVVSADEHLIMPSSDLLNIARIVAAKSLKMKMKINLKEWCSI
jgi:hypothetical protein